MHTSRLKPRLKPPVQLIKLAGTETALKEMTASEQWLELLQPQPEYFKLPSELHGPKHTARVMVLAWLLAGKHMPLIGPEMVGAAFLHDMTRAHDDLCQEHGRQAVRECLPRWRATLETIGVKDFLLVRYLVANHCVQRLRRSFPLRLFRNADLLDRVTVRPLNPKKLYDCSPELIRAATRMNEADTADLKTLLALARQA